MKQGDRVQETSTTTGTGSLTLAGATVGHRTFLVEVGEADETTYLIQASDGAWEISRGTLTGTTLTRTLVKSSTGSLLDLPAGTHYVTQVLDAATVNEFGAVAAPLTLASGTITANEPALNITQTWNNAGVTFEGMTVNITNTASAAASEAIDVRVGGNTIFKLAALLNGSAFYSPAFSVRPALQFNVTSSQSSVSIAHALNVSSWAAAQVGYLGASAPGGGICLRSDAIHGWAAGNPGEPDTALARDAADTLAQRRGTNAQTTRIYNTFTDASNYERFAISWNANTLELNTEAAGTGTKRNIVLNGANRAAYSTAAADLAACLVAHGLMAPEA